MATAAGRVWDYTVFGGAPSGKTPEHTIEMVFEKVPGGARPFNLFTVNGKAYPHDREFVLQQGQRYRLIFRNRTDDAHPLHLHRHNFELIDVNGKPTGGILKDTVIAPMYGRVTVDFTADQPGLSLFSLPYPAAHGLRLQGAVPVRLRPSVFLKMLINPSTGTLYGKVIAHDHDFQSARLTVRVLAILVCSTGLTPAYCAPWAEVGDAQLRSDIETLANAGVIDNLTTEWPVPWTRILDRLSVSGSLIGKPAAVTEAAERIRAQHQAKWHRTRPASPPISTPPIAPEVVRGFDALAARIFSHRQQSPGTLRRPLSSSQPRTVSRSPRLTDIAS